MATNQSKPMNQPKAFCPGCKKEVVFVTTAGKSTCPVCGFSYAQSEARPGATAEPPTVLGLVGAVFRVLLIMGVVVVVGLAIAFAGCVLVLR